MGVYKDKNGRWYVSVRYSKADLDYVFDFVFTGSMRLILNWIEDDKGLSTAELANRLDRLGHYCHMAIPEFLKKG